MKKRYPACLLAALILSTGCSSTLDLKKLQHERNVLSGEVTALHDKVEKLTASQSRLRKDLSMTKAQKASVEEERDNQFLQNQDIRHAVRGFIQRQLQELRELSLQRGLMEVVGSEIITRKQRDQESRVVVDFQHPLPSQATLLGFGFNAAGETWLAPCLLRPAGEQLMVVWRGKEVHAQKAGAQHVLFDVPVIAQKGDLIGVIGANGLNVTYDLGVGDGRVLGTVVAPGDSLPARKCRDKGKRAYSFHMYGVIE
ncbi:MAG: hypothetical protein KAI66_20525 [Lentisphaeria bacterium]|nr:hypothetical protein [Lentisphaeria bacterium]